MENYERHLLWGRHLVVLIILFTENSAYQSLSFDTGKVVYTQFQVHYEIYYFFVFDYDKRNFR